MFETVVDINDELHHATLQDPTTKEAVATIQAWENGSNGADFVRLVNLFAAAPEMLEALKEANISTMLYDGHKGRYATIIAKAEGRVQE